MTRRWRLRREVNLINREIRRISERMNLNRLVDEVCDVRWRRHNNFMKTPDQIKKTKLY